MNWSVDTGQLLPGPELPRQQHGHVLQQPGEPSFDWARKDWLVLACPGWNDASVASATGFISVFPGGKHNLITGLFCPETTKRYNCDFFSASFILRRTLIGGENTENDSFNVSIKGICFRHLWTVGC